MPLLLPCEMPLFRQKTKTMDVEIFDNMSYVFTTVLYVVSGFHT
jgi:galactitol-specific phosphotransferase system IIC component